MASSITKNPSLSPVERTAKFVENLSFNDSQMTELEKATKNQSISTIWQKQRKGRLAASYFKDIYFKNANYTSQNRSGSQM